MEELLKNLTDTELLTIVRDITTKHEEAKKEILALLDQYDEKVNLLNSLEQQYATIVEEISKRTE